MSQTKAQLLAPIGIITGPGLDITTASGTTFQLGSTGIITAVSANFGGNVTIGGTLTYEDVTNIDSVGLITARKGINVTAGVSTFAANIDANANINANASINVTSNINANGNIVGDNSTNISGINSVTATTFYGSAANLSGIDGGGQATGVAGLNIANGDAVAVASTDGKFYPVTGTNQSYGNIAQYTGGPISFPSVTYDTANNKVVAVRQGYSDDDCYASVGTISGTTITWGTAVAYDGTTNSRPNRVTYDSTNERIIIVSNQDSGGTIQSVVGQVSGSGASGTITFGSKTAVDSTSGNQMPTVSFDSTTGKVVAIWRNATDYYCVAKVGTVSGNSITWGAESEALNTAIERCNVACHGGYVVVVAREHVNVGQISGTGINWGTRTTIPFSNGATGSGSIPNTNVAVDPNTGTWAISACRDSKLEFFGATRSGTTLTFGSGLLYNKNSMNNASMCWSGIENRFFQTFVSGTSTADGMQSVMIQVYGTSASEASTPRAFFTDSTGSDQAAQTACCHTTDGKMVVNFQYVGNSRNGWAYVEQARFSNGTLGGYVGLSKAAYMAGQTAKVSIIGSVSNNQTGLTTASPYYLMGDGSLSTSPDGENLLVGNALSATSIALR